ncbi:RNA-directed DNA polymerase, eukaryota [Tanacetum coccineum]
MISTASKYSTKDDFVNKFPMRNIVELLDIEHDMSSIIDGAIIAIKEQEGWWYIGCRCYRKKIQSTNSRTRRDWHNIIIAFNDEVQTVVDRSAYQMCDNYEKAHLIINDPSKEVLKRFLLVEVHILGATNTLIKCASWIDSWKDAPGDDSNAMRNLCGKLKFLKVKIRAWFDKPPDQNAHIDMPFPNSLSTDQQKDLECMVSKEELIGSIYKIIAKILTNRLVGVLGDIVNEVQSAFISERQILDGPFILNEIMQWCRRRKKQSLIFTKIERPIFQLLYINVLECSHLLESFRKSFLSHGHDPRSKKASWVNWNKVLTAKERGGLGVSSLYALNRGLMCKWVWPFFAHKSLLWSRVIKAIHGPEGGLTLDVRRIFDLVDLLFVHGKVKKYVWSLENSGEFSVKSIRQVIDANCFPVIHSATRWVKFVPLKLARKISSWWNVDYVDVSSFGNRTLGCDSVGNSGGILCVWDPKSYVKLSATVSDYFVVLRGNWVSNGNLLLIISVYAPQYLTEKKLVWDYLGHVIANRKGEVIIMGDFNEVRNKNERFGSNYNVQGANAFNSFITNAGLEEVPLGGCSFTWCHRYLSDHRPILLRESIHDYGPISFRFFHYWCEVDGFEKLVNEAWYETPGDASNDMLNLMNKLKYLKKKIRAWNDTRQSFKNSKHRLKTELADLEAIIDKGGASDDIINKRTEVVKSIQEMDKLMAQKAKIKWAIEGDENSKYYHGILNKKRNQLSI